MISNQYFEKLKKVCFDANPDLMYDPNKEFGSINANATKVNFSTSNPKHYIK